MMATFITLIIISLIIIIIIINIIMSRDRCFPHPIPRVSGHYRLPAALSRGVHGTDDVSVRSTHVDHMSTR
jgi:hypothetical protein